VSKLTPYQRIVRNAAPGAGVRLSADEVFEMSLDDAIARRADLDDANDEGMSDDEATGVGCFRCRDRLVCTCPACGFSRG
jgi:hypothetical protein